MMNQLTLKLFIAGESIRSESAARNLKRVLDETVGPDYDLRIIDVTKHPSMAEDESILATPTLIKVVPSPQRRIIGDLSDREALLKGLDLDVTETDRQVFVQP